jgi:ATP-dependent DNA ligase
MNSRLPLGNFSCDCDVAIGQRKTQTAPAFVVPMAAQPAQLLTEGDDWLYELKLDRELVIKDTHRIQIRSRNDET